MDPQAPSNDEFIPNDPSSTSESRRWHFRGRAPLHRGRQYLDQFTNTYAPAPSVPWIRRSTGLVPIDFGSDLRDAGNDINSQPSRYLSPGTVSGRHSIT
ncbi:hypothetical protein B0H16DRAFT_1713047 [Mycena metata]|uniref:Uncharacterized protein n=1 Tax=Mycena metata TaxID=1033252 RepID=A0AAD7NUQ5_9AGAR|nr:hypothetical protein B0H16DRAFT_1713047 [Mycena metata]